MGTGATALGSVEALLRKVPFTSPKTTLRKTKLGLDAPLLLPLPLTATLESFKGQEKGKGKITGSKLTKNKKTSCKTLQRGQVSPSPESHTFMLLLEVLFREAPQVFDVSEGNTPQQHLQRLCLCCLPLSLPRQEQPVCSLRWS